MSRKLAAPRVAERIAQLFHKSVPFVLLSFALLLPLAKARLDLGQISFTEFIILYQKADPIHMIAILISIIVLPLFWLRDDAGKPARYYIELVRLSDEKVSLRKRLDELKALRVANYEELVTKRTKADIGK